MLSDLRPEDSGEVRFQAGPAQSVARLEVEGKRAWGAAAARGWVGRSVGGRASACSWDPRAPSPAPLLEGLPRNGSQRAVRFLRKEETSK